ncbi:AAA family ATPase [Sphingomonas sp. CROZ-RG-20F-R02-07]|uniref:McrB family protein n=1 Tax=Sphingomonas sp. CROZ-RG-20F-R02-07 TaxID=2914832 RepID=UPI001F5A3020|nr:AAA family ATPase [Sphingomonas sp. CROZ-RG-20F-R02-07]
MIRSDKARQLTAEQLGLVLEDAAAPVPPPAASSDDAALSADDAELVAVQNAIADGYAGAILSGVPGTGKSRKAALIAAALTGGDPGRTPFVQFHSSYQYEDFIEGYVPEGQGFTRQLKVFGQLCLDASETTGLYVMVIDEISRADVARVFGEALTYIERSKRNRQFKLASGTDLSVPDNIFILATMNPWDRGVDDLDAALERRFAFITMPPSETALRALLTENGLEPALVERAAIFFRALQAHQNDRCHLGHGFFVHAHDLASLARLWDLQLAYVLRRACRDNDAAFAQLAQQWEAVIAPPPAGGAQQS